MKKDEFFSKLRNKCPGDEKIEGTNENRKLFNLRNGEELTKLFLKTDPVLLTCVFEKFLQVSINELDINLSYCVSFPGYTWQCGLKYTDLRLQTLQNKDRTLIFGNTFRGVINSVMGDRFLNSDDNEKILHIDANNLYGHSLSQPIPNDETKFEMNFNLEEILNTPDDSDVGYLVEVDLSYPDIIKEKTKDFSFCPENQIIS